MPLSIYFLPGHGGRISNGLGQELVRRGFDVMGRETLGDFKKLRFDAQVETVAEDLNGKFLVSRRAGSGQLLWRLFAASSIVSF